MLVSMLHEPDEVPEICPIPELHCCLGWISGRNDGRDAEDSLILKRNGQVLVFAGEHFDDRGLITRDRLNGPSSVSALLAETGAGRDRVLRELNGWFAGILADVRDGSLLLFNDRVGLRRLHYSQTPDTFAFASEAKALLAIQREEPRWNQEALGELVACGSVLNDRTLFEGVNVLPAGSAWVVRSATHQVTKQRYFDPQEWEQQPRLTEKEFYPRLKSTLSRVVPRYLGRSPSVAISLTGGLDTRVIAAFAGEAATGLHSYTFGGMYRDCYDVKIAAEVARACGFQHEVLRLDPTFLSDFSRYAEQTVWRTDGTLDIGASHELRLNGLARRIAPVRMTGNFGSEIFRGATNFKLLGLSDDLFEPDFAPDIREATKRFSAIDRGNPASFAAFKEIPWHLFGRLNGGQSELTARSPYTDNELVALACRAPENTGTAPAMWNRLLREQNPLLASIPTDRGLVANGSSVRTLPNRLYNHLLFKGEWYYEGGMPHWLARIDRRVWPDNPPRVVVGSHKIENYRRWFRDQLFEYLRSLLADASRAGPPGVNWDRATEILVAHREGRGNFVREINRLATISLIQTLLVSRPHDRLRRRDAVEVEHTFVGR